MMNWDDPRHVTSMIIGIILTAMGAIPLLNQFGVIGFGLGPLSGVIARIAQYILAAAGLMLFVEAWFEDDFIWKITITAGILFFGIGLVPLLNSFGLIGFTIPFLSVTVYNVIFVIEGVLLMLAFFFMI